MKTIVHKAETRGQANYGWLNTRYSFSFANYYNPDRIHFGALRVLNDDTIAGGEGFGMHPHENMEIVTIMLEGELEHKDSMGHSEVLKKDEVQVMTAGTGIMHSEFNHLPDVQIKLFQIWVLPEKKGLKPRYDQRVYSPAERTDKWQLLVSPDENKSLMVHQQTWFSRGTFKKGETNEYKLYNSTSGIYIFIIEGSIELENNNYGPRDGIGLWELNEIKFKTLTNADILIIEIPLNGF